jgi:hypothetical protein
MSADSSAADNSLPERAAEHLQDGAAVADASTRPARNRGGRPSRSRGKPKSSDGAADRWTVRGVQPHVRAMAVKMAEAQGMPVGDLLEQAIVAYVRADGRPVPADGRQVPADVHGGLPAVQMPPELVTTLDSLNRRLTELEQNRSTGWFQRFFGRRS